MLAGFALSSKSSLITHDQYKAGEYNLVEFHCPAKYRVIRGMLSGPLSLNVQSHWKGNQGVSGMVSQLASVADGFGQWVGQTVRQPWFSRKFWEGTDPLKFSLPLRFIAFDNAREQVLEPMMGLLSLLYPRDQEKSGGNLFRLYRTPGPTMFYDVGRADGYEGDIVTIIMGNFLQFSGCYITGVQLNIENSFTPEGFPHTVSATVSFESMDMCFTGPYGEFFTRGFGNQAQKTNDQWLKLKGHVRGAVDTGLDKAVGYANKVGDSAAGLLNEGFKLIENIFKA